MCLKAANIYEHCDLDEALKNAKPGCAVSFDRSVYYHYAIYLGPGFVSKSDDGQDVFHHDRKEHHLVCHLTKADSGEGHITVDDFKAVAEKSDITVYDCNCKKGDRMNYIKSSLSSLGKAPYSLMTNNCEHFVRNVLEGKPECLQKFKLGNLFDERSTRGVSSSGSSSAVFSIPEDTYIFLTQENITVDSLNRFRESIWMKIHPAKGRKNRFAECTPPEEKKPVQGK